ncbi:MAG: 30S ribosomal protein S6 [Chloroflexi bacterium]|nr:30S ribosomal protein S6 [Chloroflexota bacterium]MDA1226600.1 30S ribosomal protein S6 [Chloroflexota bacterium]
MVAQRLRDYEIVLILTPQANEEEVAAIMERVSGYISEHGGTLADHDIWGLRRMAYPINKFLEGIYVLAHFSLDAKDVLELNRNLTTSEDILRHLVTKK